MGCRWRVCAPEFLFLWWQVRTHCW